MQVLGTIRLSGLAVHRSMRHYNAGPNRRDRN